MKKLELKDIACYLPYELKFINKDGIVLRMDALQARGYHVWAHQRYVKGVKDESDINYTHLILLKCSGEGDYLRRIKPILRPMYDLVNPLQDGNIPIVELAKISYKKAGYSAKLIDGECFVINAKETPIIKFSWSQSHLSFYADNLMWDGETLIRDNSTGLHRSVELFDYLNEHHFDYRGLIDEGLAIDINTLPK